MRTELTNVLESALLQDGGSLAYLAFGIVLVWIARRPYRRREGAKPALATTAALLLGVAAVRVGAAHGLLEAESARSLEGMLASLCLTAMLIGIARARLWLEGETLCRNSSRPSRHSPLS